VIDRVVIPFVEWAADRWYIAGLLLPILIAAILLGLIASLGSWWLWPAVALLAVPALAIVFTPSEERPVVDAAGWHLGHFG
jgi:endonuclease/exonuclease/phosphatase (EEP) superfamily protein YafD